MNLRCALQETRLDMITATATMIIRGRQSISINEPGTVWEYRSTHADRQYTAGDSAAADPPFLPCRYPAYGISVAQALGIDLTELMPKWGRTTRGRS